MAGDNGKLWIAPRDGQGWRDEYVLAAVNWLCQLLPSAEVERRIASTESYFQTAKQRWAQGDRVPLFDKKDTISWYLHQGIRYADPNFRPDFFLPEGYRIAPVFRRLGQLLPNLIEVEAIEERAARILNKDRGQPDDALYELLVAGAYKCRGWDKVEFLEETPGLGKRNDIFVERGPEHWAIECKRTGRSGYAYEERVAAENIAQNAHSLSKRLGKSFVTLVQYKEEIIELGESYLESKIERFFEGSGPFEWDENSSRGVVFDLPWHDLYVVLNHDDIYFGSSRMVELILGQYDPVMDFTMDGTWTPAEGRPLHATWVDQASLVVWRSTSEVAEQRKARHFRSVVGRASQQLPGDSPGAVHVGYENVGGNGVERLRHQLNQQTMLDFDPGETGLRMVYGNYFMPELVTSRNESCAVSETLAWYPVGGGREVHPLPEHMLFSDEDGLPGEHF